MLHRKNVKSTELAAGYIQHQRAQKRRQPGNHCILDHKMLIKSKDPSFGKQKRILFTRTNVAEKKSHAMLKHHQQAFEMRQMQNLPFYGFLIS